MNYSILALVLLVALLLYFQSKKRKTKKALLLQKQEDEVYRNYLNKFQDISTLKKLPVQEVQIAGVRYQNDDGSQRQDIIRECKKGERLMLIPDSINQYDKHAIQVLRLNRQQIGFLDMDLAIEVKSRLEASSPVEASIIDIKEEKETLQVYIALQKYSLRSNVSAN
ncbi:HIRAN domain-containing protein [Algivirga pacifica]|uniref:HIRAN domain-containing protein n=1 Tax=Algivirga pacifica TaxID=1162670 RepID=A0ABP9DF36_9BACT